MSADIQELYFSRSVTYLKSKTDTGYSWLPTQGPSYLSTSIHKICYCVLKILSLTYPLDFAVTLVTGGSEVLLKAELAVETVLFLNKADVLQGAPAFGVHADKVLWTPDFTKSCDEWSPVHHMIDIRGSSN